MRNLLNPGVVSLQLRESPKSILGHLNHGERTSDTEVRESGLLPSEEVLVPEEGLKEGQGVLQLDLLLSIVLLSEEQLRVKVIPDGLVEGSDIEVQVSVNDGPLLSTGRIQRVARSVLVHQVGTDGSALTQSESIVHQSRNRVLGIQLEELRPRWRPAACIYSRFYSNNSRTATSLQRHGQ